MFVFAHVTSSRVVSLFSLSRVAHARVRDAADGADEEKVVFFAVAHMMEGVDARAFDASTCVDMPGVASIDDGWSYSMAYSHLFERPEYAMEYGELVSAAPSGAPATCVDTDNGAADMNAYACQGGYVGWESTCGSYDDDDFSANAMVRRVDWTVKPL